MKVSIFVLALVILAPLTLLAQIESKFMAIGSLQSWFANTGCEIEEGRTLVQQDGVQWPAIYLYQDAEAAKGFWIGAKNFTDERGQNFPFKVVHNGPRVNGAGEFFPIRFDMISKFDPPAVSVDGEASEDKPLINNFVDPNLPCDRMIIDVVNTALGITMTRKILAFGQQFHDNYFIYEYTFKNTGNTDADADIELPSTTVSDVYFYWQYRYAICKESRYVVGNSSGWGINTMNDTRGDGLSPATTFFPGNRDNDVRAQYAWHGRHPGFAAYDNIGAPVFSPPQNLSEPFSDRNDTTGRLTAPQFVGVATIYADSSATAHRDDFGQPRTTSYEGSDEPYQSQNDQFNIPKMTTEYQVMSLGHLNPRHADRVGPTGDPSIGRQGVPTSGGQSCVNGYGPYLLAPGDSVKIVMVEAMAGLSRERSISVGRRFKANQISATAKNDSVYTGRDSLFQTFRRAIANYQSNYTIPLPPKPPKDLTVTSGGDKINLSWGLYETDPNLTGFQLYRSVGRYDTEKYEKIADLPASARSYDDQAVVRGVAYFYYMLSVGQPTNSGVGNTPNNVPLLSSRFFAQTYDPGNLRRQAGNVLDSIRIVPNPYTLGSDAGAATTDPNQLRFPGEKDKIAFFNIPGNCKIRIFTELGEQIAEIDHTNGSGD